MTSNLSPGSAEWVLAFADDEHMIGARHAAWIGLGPFLEEDLAFCSIAQDELGQVAIAGVGRAVVARAVQLTAEGEGQAGEHVEADRLAVALWHSGVTVVALVRASVHRRLQWREATEQ